MSGNKNRIKRGSNGMTTGHLFCLIDRSIDQSLPLFAGLLVCLSLALPKHAVRQASASSPSCAVPRLPYPFTVISRLPKHAVRPARVVVVVVLLRQLPYPIPKKKTKIHASSSCKSVPSSRLAHVEDDAAHDLALPQPAKHLVQVREGVRLDLRRHLPARRKVKRLLHVLARA